MGTSRPKERAPRVPWVIQADFLELSVGDEEAEEEASMDRTVDRSSISCCGFLG